MIEIISHTHARELIALSGIYLEQHESENNRTLDLIYKLAEDPDYYRPDLPLLLSILENGRTVGVAIISRRRVDLSKISTEVQTAIVHLVRHLRGIDVQIPGVIGPAVEVQTFSDCWAECMPGVSFKVTMRMRLFEARAVADLSLSPGKLRVAHMDDHSLVTQWMVDYSEEIGKPVNFDFTRNWTEQFITDQRLYIWDHNGPVSIAGVYRQTKNSAAIAGVYTPPEHRNQGYATSSVSMLTKKLLSAHYSFCCLYTDLSNPTSNSIYAKIGYVPVGDALAVDFQSNRGGSKT